ncbi:hypothetical protein [Cellulophaga sp. E16_2]|uniref:hypothetical protein n=1 Tax=Cellulophaga sp. E16_2 TaxID=2789297 RepID=UPI002107B83B|nr:hypothetical protein [Cellulophaga sp. E16_2]
MFLASTTVEGSYEYFLNEDTSVGGTLYFDNTPLNYNGNFGIGPNFRAYLGYAPRVAFLQKPLDCIILERLNILKLQIPL